MGLRLCLTTPQLQSCLDVPDLSQVTTSEETHLLLLEDHDMFVANPPSKPAGGAGAMGLF